MTVKTAQGGDGAFVIKISSDGPAGRAGIKLGDLITMVDGVRITDSRDVLKVVGY